jgi:predicted nucleic acid-binding protein
MLQKTMTGTSTANEFCLSGYRLFDCPGGLRRPEPRGGFETLEKRRTEILFHRKFFSIVTTTYVFDEVVTFFNDRGHHAKAVEIGRRLRESQLVEIVPETEVLFEAGWSRFQNRPDKRYSLTDCLSFVLMERRDIETALAFDHHFEQAGYQLLP